MNSDSGSMSLHSDEDSEMYQDSSSSNEDEEGYETDYSSFDSLPNLGFSTSSEDEDAVITPDEDEQYRYRRMEGGSTTIEEGVLQQAAEDEGNREADELAWADDDFKMEDYIHDYAYSEQEKEAAEAAEAAVADSEAEALLSVMRHGKAEANEAAATAAAARAAKLAQEVIIQYEKEDDGLIGEEIFGVNAFIANPVQEDIDMEKEAEAEVAEAVEVPSTSTSTSTAGKVRRAPSARLAAASRRGLVEVEIENISFTLPPSRDPTYKIIKDSFKIFKSLIKIKAKEMVEANKAKGSGRDFKMLINIEVAQPKDTLAQAIAKGYHKPDPDDHSGRLLCRDCAVTPGEGGAVYTDCRFPRLLNGELGDTCIRCQVRRIKCDNSQKSPSGRGIRKPPRPNPRESSSELEEGPLCTSPARMKWEAEGDEIVAEALRKKSIRMGKMRRWN